MRDRLRRASHIDLHGSHASRQFCGGSDVLHPPPADDTLTLTKDTTYAVVLTTPQHGDYLSQGWSATDATGEDTVSAAEWSIADGHLLRTSQSEVATWSSTRGVQPLRIAIRGTTVGGTTPSTPDAPTEFTATLGNMEVALAWDAPASGSGVTGHEYRYKTTGNYLENWTAIADSAVAGMNEASFTVTELTNGTQYTFQLRAVSAAGNGDEAEADPVTPMLGICDRTAKIQEVILGEISGVDNCAAVTDANLASITQLGQLGFGTFNQGITSLQKGDFAGLTSLTILRLGQNGLTALPEGIFAGLAELDELNLFDNQLESLPEGVFDGLVKLEGIVLSSNSLTGVPAGAFDGLPVLVEIDLGGNDLSSLPEDLFSGLTALTTIFLGSNDLESLPDGVFSGLTALENLQLNDNDLTMFPVTMFSGLPALEKLQLDGNDLTMLPVTVFSGLTALKNLQLNDNDLTMLPVTVFSGLPALDKLYLHDNDLTALPDGLFTGVTLGTLHLGNNPDADDVLPLTVTVEKVGTDQVRAKVLAGAPFAVDIPVTLVDGTLAGSVTELSVAAGEVYSEPVTMTRTVGTTAAATVDVDLTTQPTLPADNSGYAFIKAATGLPETILPGSGTPAAPTNFRTTPGDGQVALAWDAPVSGSGVTGHEYRYKTTGTYTSWTAITDSGVGGATGVTVTGLTNAEAYTFELRAVNATGEGAAAAVVVIPMLGICGRTQQIEDAILAAISGVDDCAEVTDANLAAITSFSDDATISKGISTLRRGDFAGLTSLTAINLFGNSLTSLPEGIFAGLAELTELSLGSNQLASLPEGVFDGLVKLKFLNLGGNSFTEFPAGTFAGLTAMHTLELKENGLTTLPDGLFFGLTALLDLRLGDNALGSLDAGVFSGLTSLRLLSLDNNELSSLVAPQNLIGPRNPGISAHCRLPSAT